MNEKTFEEVIHLFRKRLFSAFWEWVEKNKGVVGERWHAYSLKEGRKAENNCNDIAEIMGTSLWMFNMISAWVGAGIGPNRVGEIQHLAEGIDEVSTKRLLNMIAACLALQYLPRNFTFKEIES